MTHATASIVSAPDQAPNAPALAASLVGPLFAFVLLVAFSPTLNDPDWTLRLTLVLAAAGGGVVLVAVLVRSNVRTAAFAGCAFIGTTTAAALFSDRPWLSILGAYGGGGSVVLIAGCVGAWGIGVWTDEVGRRRLCLALAGGVMVNASVAVVQGFANLTPMRLGSPDGSQGLLGNPVHLGAALAGAIALAAVRSLRDRRWLSVIAVGAIVLPFTGSRMGTAAALLAVLAVCRSRRGLLPVAVLLVGLVAGEAVHTLAQPGAQSTGAKAFGTQSIQVAQRADAWTAALDASFDRPLGYGPGRFVEASSPRTTLRLARAAPDVVYGDAHNFVLEVLATTGWPGLACFLGFGLLAARRARGPLAAFAASTAMVYLMQPLALSTVPLVFLALGAAGPPARLAVSRHTAMTAVSVALAAAFFGMTLVVGDFHLRQADLDFDATDARLASHRLFGWPEPVAKLGVIAFFHATTSTRPDHASALGLEEAEASFVDAARRDPAIATAWNNLADLQLYRREVVAAHASFARARRTNPWSVRALVGGAATARLLGDDDTSNRLAAQAAEVVPRSIVDKLIGERLGANSDRAEKPAP